MIYLPLDLELIADEIVPMKAMLTYDTADPYAATLTVSQQSQDAEWQFARDLLAEGFVSAHAAGYGDVRIWLCSNDNIHILLRSPEGAADLHAQSKDIADFLSLAYALVPPGRELDKIDMDGELAEILGEAA